jgi:two-component sensor histidine kinase/predicted negative regulator of RcsB-dependent stress response
MKSLSILITLLFYSLLVFSQSAPSNEKHIIDSLNSIIKNTNSSDTSVAEAYVGLSEILAISNLDTVIYLCDKAKEIAEKNLKENLDTVTKKSFLLTLAASLNNIGYVYKQKNNFSKALEFYNKSLQTREAIGDKTGIANSLNNIGAIYDDLGKIEKALENYDKSLQIQEEIGDKKNAAISLINIGSLYYYQGDTVKSLDFIYKAIDILEKLDNRYFLSVCQNNIGNILNNQNKPQEALSILTKSLNIRKDIGDKQGIATCLNNIAISYSILAKQTNNTSSKDSLIHVALSFYHKSLKILEEIGDKKNIASSLVNIGEKELNFGNVAQAKKYALRSFSISKELGQPVSIRESAKLLSLVYEKQGEGMQALEMHKLYITMRDSVNNIETQKATIKQSMQYDFDKKEALASVEHEKKLAIKEAEKQQQTIIIWAGAIVLILIIGVSAFIANRLKLSNKQKLLIEQKNKENELLLGEIHHRVKNNLQIISSLLSLQERSIDDVATKSAIAEGKERVKSMGLIHKMLYQNDNYSGVEMDNYGKELIGGLIDSFGMKESDIDVNLNFSHLKLDIDTAIPIGLIINELVINTLKYAYKETSSPSLKVSLIKQSEHLTLEVKDNGSGKVDNLENSKSFGMKLIKSLSRQIGGTVSIQSNAGICVSINIANYKLI